MLCCKFVKFKFQYFSPCGTQCLYEHMWLFAVFRINDLRKIRHTAIIR
jgi:hypothetical protein